MGKVMRHTLGASLNIRHNLSSSKGPKPLQLKLLTTYIPKTSAFTLAFSTSKRLRTTRAKIGRAAQQECRDRPRMPSTARHNNPPGRRFVIQVHNLTKYSGASPPVSNLMLPRPQSPTLFPYTTLFRS